MTYGSLFSGAGGFDLGFDEAGMSCSFQCEIDATASSVLAHHWPDVTKHNDVREIGKRNLPSVDVLVGGFPCQDLSVAGQRKGLHGGTRSGLFYELARIAGELRPRYLVFENVPGLLSSDDGRDFARVIRHLGDCGFHGGWRVLDAEGFGVAQHRRRVFGVFTRERSRIGCVAEILTLRESLRWHPAEGRKAGPDIAADAGSGLEVRGVVNALTANGVGTKGADDTQAQAGHFIPIGVGGSRSHALTAEGHDASEDGTTRAMPIVAFFSANDSSNGSYRETDRSHTLSTGTDTTRAMPQGGRSLESQENLAYALTAPQGGGRGQERNQKDWPN